jgi:hypothetical protein
MVMISKNARLRYSLNNVASKAPEDIQSTEIIASFDDDGVQANITANDWTFYNEDAQTIKQWITDGKIYQGLPFKIEAYNNQNNVVAFDGLLDLTNDFEDKFDDEGRVKCAIQKAEGLNIFFNQVSALSFDFLESKGVFTANDYTDCDYVVQKPLNLLDQLSAALVLFLMITELITQIKEIAEEIAHIIAHSTPLGFPGAIFAVAKIIIKLAYAASILLVIIDLGKQLMDSLLPPVRTHRTLKFSTAMSKVCNFLGYGFSTSIALLDDIYYLPSNPQIEPKTLQNFLSDDIGTQKGIPRNTDPHHFCQSFFELAKKIFYGKFAIVNGVVQFHTKGSSYWIESATYQMPSVRPKSFTYNTNDVAASTLLGFSYDINDDYTIDNFTGNVYEIQTTLTNSSLPKNNTIKGFNEINLDVALGSPKTEALQLETQLQGIGAVIDAVVNFFGGNSNYGASPNPKIGVLKQTENWHAVPKVLMLQGRKLHPSYRTIFSAKRIYEDYYSYDSFVLNNYGGQKKVYSDIKIPFGMEDYLAVIDNSYFTTSDGSVGKITSLKWKITRDTATVSYWIKSPFTTQLQETYIEP